MAEFTEYLEHDAIGLAGLVRDKHVTAEELVEAALARIQEVDPAVNAVVHLAADEARRQAADHSGAGPFAGVPFLIKDLHASVAGAPITHGSRAMERHTSEHDSELVARYRDAGLISMGKTNTPEFGLAPTTEPELHGPTHNPWMHGYTSGGSSGGSAAAVAAGMVPMAHASDGGGSIRIPASACGLFGLKPTRGRLPHGPDVAEGWFGLSEHHAVTRSVRDSAALLDATHGPDLGAPYVAPPPHRPFLEEVGADPGRLHIAFTTKALFRDGEVEPACAEAVLAAAALCEELGHEVVEAAPSLDQAGLTGAFVTIVAAGAAFDVEEAARLSGGKPKADDHELTTWLLYLVARKTGSDVLARALHDAKQAGRAMAQFHTDYDVLLTSTLADPPWAHGALDPSPQEVRLMQAVRRAPAKKVLSMLVDQMADEVLKPMPNTPLFNMTGQPAMSVPLTWDSGLPIGVQFAGRFGDEATLFRLASQLEAAQPWWFNRPVL